MKTEQLATMLEIQDRLNSSVNPDWRNAGNDWSLAVMIECGELIDHIGWKWWKKQDMDLPQAQIELVDIWHFFLSSELEKRENLSTTIIAAALSEEIYQCNRYEPAPSTVLIRNARGIAEYAARGQIHLYTLARLWQQLGMTDEDLFRMYVGKAALNLFRYENGYKDGTYIKQWFGREDNFWLEQILDTGVTELHTIFELLSHQYASVKIISQRLDAKQ